VLLLLLQEITSEVNAQFLATSQELSNQFVPGGVPVNQVAPSKILELRLTQLKTVNINQVREQCQPGWQV
jgi:hypothetical protein